MAVTEEDENGEDTIYHYCSPQAFFNIIYGKSIWAADLRTTNDQKEGDFIEILSSIYHEDHLGNEEYFEFIPRWTNISEEMQAFGFCLSENGDLLSQWRSYSADGRGFSIGFSKQDLESVFRDHQNESLRFYSGRAIYDAGEQRTLVNKHFEKVLNIVGNPRKTEEGGRIKFHYDNLLPALGSALSGIGGERFLIKNSHFLEESEFRCVLYGRYTRRSEFNFLPTQDGIRQYYELNFENRKSSLIQRVFMGPKNRSERVFVQNFLKACDLPDVKVIRSSAPYR